MFLSWRLLQIKGTILVSLNACRKVVKETQEKVLYCGKTEARHSKAVRAVVVCVLIALDPFNRPWSRCIYRP